MKANILKLGVSAAVALTLFAACSEQTPGEFDQIEGVYFNNRSNTSILQDSADVTFVYQKGDEMEVSANVQLLGRPADKDRKVNVVVTSDDAIEGTDYVLPTTSVLPAGATTFNYTITLKRTSVLKTTKKHLLLTLQPSADFTLPVSSEVTSNGDEVTTLTYRIIFSDQFTTKPKAWENGLLGSFTQQKFELICKVLDVDPSDFTDDTKMTLPMQAYICAEMTNYVSEQKSKRDAGEAYDSDAFHADGTPLSFEE